MKTWEVIIPPAGGGALRALTIQSATWMMALSEALRQLSDPAPLSSLMCNITPHGSLEIVDSQGRRTITIREVSAATLEAPNPTAGPPLPQAPTPSLAVPSPPAAADAGGDNATVPRPIEAYARRHTAEMVALATDFFDKKPPPPEPAAPSPKMAGSLVSAGEIAPMETYRKPITEPAIIIDATLAAEIEELESLRRSREVAMAPPEGRPIPHKVFKVMAEALEWPRPEAVRRRYVSVWPNPPEEALNEVLLLQLGQVQAELAGLATARRVIIAAFDHAFDRTPDRPPLGLCTWEAMPGQDAPPRCILGEEAARAWAPMSAAQGAAAATKDPARTAIVSIPGPELTGTWPTTSQPFPTSGVPQTPKPAPDPVAYPPELRITVYQGTPPAPPPAPAPPSLDPHWATPPPMAPAPGQPLALAPAPPATFPSAPTGLARDLGAITFERMHALFYMTDREHALAFCLDTAMGLIPSQAGAVLIYDPSPRELYLAVARGPRAASPHGVRVPVHEGLAGFCAMEGLPLALSTMDEDQRFHTSLESHYGLSVHSIVGAPIQYEGRFYGVMELVNHLPEGSYQGEEVNALAYIARQLAERLATALVL